MVVPKVEAKRKGHWVYVDDGVEMEQSFQMVSTKQQIGSMVEKVNQAPAGGFQTYGYASTPMPAKAQAQPSVQQSGAFAQKQQAYTSGAYGAMQPSYGSYASYTYDPKQQV